MKYFGEKPHPLRFPDQFKSAVLHAICRTLDPKVVVETGVAQGASSLGILSALKINNHGGRLYSIDAPGSTYTLDDGGKWTDLSSDFGPGWLVPMTLKTDWTLKVGRSREVLPSLLERIDPVDLFYHDSEHTSSNMMFEFATAWARMHAGSILVADNVNWSDAFERFNRSRQVFRSVRGVLFPFLGVIRKSQ
jgi:predicted O-methyltransferase YrrM